MTEDWRGAIDEYAQRAGGTLQPNTVRQYQGQLYVLAKWAASQNIELSAFRRRHMERYLASKQTTTAGTRRADCIIAKVFTDWCAEEGLLPRGVLDDLALPKKQKPHVNMPSADALKALLGSIAHRVRGRNQSEQDAKWYRTRDRAIVLTLAETGLRPTELCNLTDPDLDLGKRIITVRTSKTGEPRYIPITASLSLTLSEWGRLRDRPRNRKSDRAFPSIWDEPLTADALRQHMRRYWDKSGLDHFTLYALRHYALSMLGQRTSIVSVMQIAGHKNLSTSQRYLHTTIEIVRADVEKAGTLDEIAPRKPIRRKVR